MEQADTSSDQTSSLGSERGPWTRQTRSSDAVDGERSGRGAGQEQIRATTR